MELVTELETVVLERDGAVAQVRINRPERMNAVYRQVYLDVVAAVEAVRLDDSLRAMVLTGTGDRAFCAGGDIHLDLDVIGQMPVKRLFDEAGEGADMIRAIRRLPKPVIARVQGVAVGGGCDLALCCDIVIAATTARFGEFWIRRGLVPDMGGAHFLPRLVGTHKAKELLFTGDGVTGEEAARINLINRAVLPERLDEEVYALAHRLAAMPTLAIGITKDLVNKSMEQDLDTNLEAVRSAVVAMAHTRDHREGVDAYLEKREPVFRGE